MEEIIQITQLALTENPCMPEAQKQLITSISFSLMIPVAIIFVINKLINEE